MNIFICSHNKYITGCTAIECRKPLIQTKNSSNKANNNRIKYQQHSWEWTLWKKLKINTNPNIIDGNNWEITWKICQLKINTKDLFQSRNINENSTNNQVLLYNQVKDLKFIQKFRIMLLGRLKVHKIVEKKFINHIIDLSQVDHHIHFLENPKKWNYHSNPINYQKETGKRCLEVH